MIKIYLFYFKYTNIYSTIYKLILIFFFLFGLICFI